MEEMQRQMADFVSYVRNELMAGAQHADPAAGASPSAAQRTFGEEEVGSL